MMDKFSKLTKAIDIAVEEACAVVDNAATQVMSDYLNSLRQKYHNHHFRYMCGMGVRSLEVYKKCGERIASIDSYGVEWLGTGLYDRSSNLVQPFEDMAQFMLEFTGALNQQHYFDADESEPLDISNN